MSIPGKVSVIIPCYNYGRYLRECVESVFAQTYLDWEVVIVDDGSTDDSQEVAQALVARNPTQVSYHRTANQGVSAARNHALAHSSGEFILPLDADDKLRPEALEKLVATISEDSSYGLAYCSMGIIDVLPGEPKLWIPGPNSEQLLPFQNFIPITSLWRRAVCDTGAHYRQVFFEDWDLWLQIVARGYRVAYNPEILFDYRKHPHGRDRRNRFFYFQALCQQALGSPSLYPPSFHEFAKRLLAPAPGCFSKPTIVFLPHPDSAEFSSFNGRLARLADEFLKRGHTVATFGEYRDNQNLTPGLLTLDVGRTDFADKIIFNLGRVGAEVIVLSEHDESLSYRLKILENVFAVVNIAGKEDARADRSIVESHGDYRPLNSLKSINGTTAVVDYLLELYENNHRESIAKTRELRDKLNLLGQAKQQWQGCRISDPQISVAIPVRNVDAKRLERCLQSIRETEPAPQTPIIISDFGSSAAHLPAMQELCLRYQAQLLTSNTRAPWSRSRALNIAIRNCSTPWILMTDVDMVFSPELIPMWREYRALIGDHFMYLCQCKKLPPIHNLPFPWHSTHFERISAQGRLFDTHGQGGCQILPTAWLQRVRGFNEAYTVWGLEDNDLSFRANLDNLQPIWMQPGKLLHQWHIKAVSTKARDDNRTLYQALLREPKLIVNGESWGTISEEELTEYNQLGPKEFVAAPEYTIAKEIETALLNAASTTEQINLLLRWGSHALHCTQDESAAETFEDVLTIDSENFGAMLGLSQTLFLQHAYSHSGHYAKRALALAQDSAPAREILAHAIAMTAKA